MFGIILKRMNLNFIKCGNMNKNQEALEKILESCKDEIDTAVKKAFYDYLIFGEGKVQLEIHADGVKEITCGFCSEPCGNDWCPTKE